MKPLFPLALSCLKSRRRSTALLLSAIILSTAFLTVMGLTGSSALYTIDLQNKDLYGEQKAVAWNLSDEHIAYFQNSSTWNEIGKITVYGLAASLSGTPLFIGTMDEQAIKLGHIRLAEGRFAQAADEIALEKNAYRHIGGRPYAVGDAITLEITTAGQETKQHTFQVVGLIEDYSAVWRNAFAKQTNNNTELSPENSTVPAFPAFLTAEPMAGGFPTATAGIWLLNSPGNSYQALHGNLPENISISFNYSVFPEIGYYGGMGEAALFAFKLGALIGGLILVCMAAILLNGFLLAADKRRRQFSLLRCIGATKKQACTWLFCESFLLLFMGIPAGLLLGTSLSFGAVRLFSRLNDTDIFYHFNAWILVAAAFACVFFVCLATLLPAVRASKTAPVMDTKTIYYSGKTKGFQKIRMTPFGLLLLSMQKSKGKTILTTATFALVIVVFHVMLMTDITEYRTEGTYQSADATLHALEIYSRKEDGFLWNDSEGTDAITALAFSDFGSYPDIACQNAAVIPRFYCSIPFSRYDSYLNGHFRFDYKMLGLKNWEKWGQYHYSFEPQIGHGYTEQEYLIEPKITIFDDVLLEQFQSYVVDGAINLEAINQGEEIILCMPDYYSLVLEDENGLEIKEWLSNLSKETDLPEEACLLTNTSWAAGDTLTFTWLSPQGGTDLRQERTVKIGAVAKGAPPIEDSSNGVFCIAAGQNTLENLDMPYEITKIHLYFEEDADVISTESYLEEISSRLYPLTRLSTQTETALAARRQRHTRLAVSGMISICLLTLGLLGLINTVSNRIYNRLHEIGLLRCIGMTKGQVYRMFVYEGIVFGLMSSLLGIAISLWFLSKYQENWMQTQMPFYFILSTFACTLLSVLTILPSARAALQKSPADITRTVE